MDRGRTVFRHRTYSGDGSVPATAANGAGTPFKCRALFLSGAASLLAAIYIWGLPALLIISGLMLLYAAGEVRS